MIAAATAYIGIAYGEYLLYGLSLEYMKAKKTVYFSKKRFFNIPLLSRYVTTGAWIGLFALLPYLGALIIFVIFVFGFGGVAVLSEYLFVNPQSFVAIAILLLFLVAALLSAYIIFRTAFALLLLIDTKRTSTKAITYIKKSVSITQGSSKFFRFV